MTDATIFRVTYTCICERSRRVDFSLKIGGKKKLHCPCGRAFLVTGAATQDVVPDATSKPARSLKAAAGPKLGKAALRKASAELAVPHVYTFCESSSATGLSPWHIRCLSVKGPKFGGGADTPFLCNREYFNAWDIRVEIDAHHLQHACKACVEIFKKAAPPV